MNTKTSLAQLSGRARSRAPKFNNASAFIHCVPFQPRNLFSFPLFGIYAAKVTVLEGNKVEVENYGIDPVKLKGVRKY